MENPLVYQGSDLDKPSLFIGVSKGIIALQKAICQNMTPFGSINKSGNTSEAIANLYSFPKINMLIYEEQYLNSCIHVLKLFPSVHNFVVATTISPNSQENVPDIPPPFMVDISTESVTSEEKIPGFLDFASSATLTYCIKHKIGSLIMACFIDSNGITANALCEVANRLSSVFNFDIDSTVEQALSIYKS